MPHGFRQQQRYPGQARHGGREGAVVVVVAHVMVEVKVPENGGRVVRAVVLSERGCVHQPVRGRTRPADKWQQAAARPASTSATGRAAGFPVQEQVCVLKI